MAGFGLLNLLAPELNWSESSEDSFWMAPSSPTASPTGSPATIPIQVKAILLLLKYVDDTNLVETVDIRHITANTPLEEIPAAMIRPFMDKVIELFTAIGMKVICLKTQMIVIKGDTG